MRHYTKLAGLFCYPKAEFASEVLGVQHVLDSDYPEAGKMLKDFTSFIQGKTLSELEELYIRTFDVGAICYLDLGYVLFGEDYKRGAFLVHMRQEQVSANNPCGLELPDHLPNVLTLFSRTKDSTIRKELAVKIVIPAIELMLGGFKNKGNIYQKPLSALSLILNRDFADSIDKKDKQPFFTRNKLPVINENFIYTS